MAQRSQPSRKQHHSITYAWDPHKGARIQISDPVRAVNSPTTPGITKSSVGENESNPNPMLRTGQLVSVIGQVWGYATHPLSSNKPVENNDTEQSSSPKNGLISVVDDKGQEHVVSYTPPKLQSKPDVSSFRTQNGDRGSSSLVNSGTITAMGLLEEKIFSGVRLSKELRNIYSWMSQSDPSSNNFRYHHSISMQEDGNENDYSVEKDSNNCLLGLAGGVTQSATDNMVSMSRDRDPAMIAQNNVPSCESSAHTSYRRNDIGSHKADCLVRAINVIEKGSHLSRAITSSPSGHYSSSAATLTDRMEECPENIDDIDNKLHQVDESDLRDRKINISSEDSNKPEIAPAKQQHAVAGAMAGICVSLCLHPVDTLKTVVQACHLDQKSICDVGRSIISERGLSGLYRGIASNIASSAPISAVYTFTYESVKGVLLPLFPKEYCSVAHCTAGGCASVATSFIFTPSERIKQQMQVRSNYQNCWSALIGVIQKGGLASLYAGWGAVLCRNVPHSIIKFYAYESLKGSVKCNDPNTFQTLACGGVAGATAALFSTPFDVVKTRLQTQIPGSAYQYRSVFHAIQEITKNEGFKGLYRGLAPRLIMYMTQGGLFFASYEFFKGAFGLKAL